MPRTAFDCLASATRMAFPSTVCAHMNVGADCALTFTDSVVRVANTAGLFAGEVHGTKGRLLELGLTAAGGNSVQSLHCLITVREMPGTCRSQSTNTAERVIIESPRWLRSRRPSSSEGMLLQQEAFLDRRSSVDGVSTIAMSSVRLVLVASTIRVFIP